MNKLYTLLFFIILIIFSGCEANYDENNDTQIVTSEANVTINNINNINNKTNDTTPAFSGKFFDINNDIGISLSVGGATYKIYPDNSEDWSLDTEVPNVRTTSNKDISKQTSGPVPLSLSDGQHTLILEAQDINGTVYRFEKLFTVDTTSDVTITDINLTKTSDIKPKISGKSTNVNGIIELKIVDKEDEDKFITYHITPFENGDWSLDTATQTAVSQGNITLDENKLYYIDIKAKDIDLNYIDTIRTEYTPGSFRLTYAYYNNFATNSTNDDIAYIYLNRRFAPSSLASPSDVFNVFNQGSIGSNSSNRYSMQYHYVYTLYLDNTGTQSDEFNKSTELSLNSSGITDYYGIEPESDNQKVKVQYLNSYALLNTFSKQCVMDDENSTITFCNDTNNTLLKNDAYNNYTNFNNSDFYFKSFLENRTFVRNNNLLDFNTSDFNSSNNTGTITDDNNTHWSTNNNVLLDVQTHLMWQIADNNISVNYTDAMSYCDNLILNNIDDWRLPSIQEMTSVINRNNGEIYNNILSVYIGQNGRYWSNNVLANGSNEKQWIFDFGNGQNYITDKIKSHYTKCVHER